MANSIPTEFPRYFCLFSSTDQKTAIANVISEHLQTLGEVPFKYHAPFTAKTGDPTSWTASFKSLYDWIQSVESGDTAEIGILHRMISTIGATFKPYDNDAVDGQILTLATTVAYDARLGKNAFLTAPGSGVTIGELTSAADGESGNLFIGGGANSPSWHSSWSFGTAGAPTLTNDSTKMDLIRWHKIGGKTVATFHAGFPNLKTVTNTAPVVDLNGAGGGITNSITYTEGDSATAVAPAATVTEPQGAPITSLTITVAGVAEAASEFVVVNGQRYRMNADAPISGTAGSFTVDFDYATGVFTITKENHATAAEVQALIRAVTYENTATPPTDQNRTLTFVASDGLLTSSSAVATVDVNPA